MTITINKFYIAESDLVQVTSGIEGRECGADDSRTGTPVFGCIAWDGFYLAKGDLDWVRSDSSWRYLDQITRDARPSDLVEFKVADTLAKAREILASGERA